MKPLNFSLLTLIKLSTASFLLCFSLILPVWANEDITTSTPPVTDPAPEPTLPTVKIHLQIETFDQTLYNDDLEVKACLSTPSSTEPTLNAWCAIEQIAQTKNWTIDYSTYGDAKFLSVINNYNGADFNWWAFFHNLDFAGEALNQYILFENDRILLSYGIFPLKIETDNASPLLNSTSTLKIYAFGFDPNSWAPTWSLSPSTTVVINDQEFLSSDGNYELQNNHYIPYNILAKKEGAITSNSLIVSPQLPVANIHLQIAGLTADLYNQDLAVTACEESPGSGIYTLNGLCAIKQTGLTNDWNYFGTDAFLNSIGETANNQDNNFIYWMWFADLKDGQVALNKHLLSPKENLLLTYGRNPLRISVGTSTPLINTTSTVSLEEFGFDASWNAVWLPAVSSTLIINDQEIYNDSGLYELPITTTTPYIIYGKKGGYLDSSTTTIVGQPIPPDEPAPAEEQPIPPPASSGGGGGGGSVYTHNVIDTLKAVQYLLANQNADGSIGSTLYSDWAAIALAAAGQNNEALKNYLLADPSAAGGLNEVSDSARRAMALMALGINPYNGTKTNYIQKITDTFDGTQFGDRDLYNDDIFALFPLLRAGYTANDSLVTSTIKFILSKQNSNGAWDGVDLTAAAVQALSQAKNIEGVESALNKAREFLRNQQQSNGGWGNTFSTSWAAQAIMALGENQSNWEKEGKNPNDYLYTQQGADGGLEKDSIVTSTRLWATSYAIPATLGKTWPQILNNFTKPTNATAEVNGVGGYYPETTTTTTVPTSTLLAVVTPTSTPEIVPEITIEPVKLPMVIKEEIKKIEPKNEDLVETITRNTVIKSNKDEQNDLQLSAAPAAAEDNTEKIINALPLDTPTRRTAKKVAAVTGGGALVVGLYLGLRILKNVI